MEVGVFVSVEPSGNSIRLIEIGSIDGSVIPESGEWNRTEPPTRIPLLAIVA